MPLNQPQPGGYTLYQPSIHTGFLKGPYGQAWGEAFGSVKDYLSDLTKQGITQRWAASAQIGALAMIGQERGIPQGSNETTATYVASLINAWSEWELAGSPWSILGLMNFLGYANVYLISQNGNAYGPSGSVVLPNPNLGIAGVPPTVVTDNEPWTLAIGGLAFGSQGVQYPMILWQPSTSYTNATVIPNPPNGLIYSMTGTHTSGTSAPAWPGTVGGTVSDGAVTWTCVGSSDFVPGSPGYIAEPVGQSQGYVRHDFWSAYFLIFDPAPASWTNIMNPPTATSAPGAGEIRSIMSLITAFNAGYATCCGLLVAGNGARATFGWPTGRTFYGDVGYAAGSTSADGLTKFWIPHETGVIVGQNVIPTAPNGYIYSCSAKTTGITGYVQPTWPTTTGLTVVDVGVTWKCLGAANTYLTGTTPAATTFSFVPQSAI